MGCISAYEYVVVEAKMTKIFAVYFQTSDFPNQSSEYAFECSCKQLWRYGIPLSYSSPGVDLVAFFVSSSCLCRFLSGVRCTHLMYPVLETRSVLLEFALGRKLSRSRRMRRRLGYYIFCTSPSVGLRRGCGLSLSICFRILFALVVGFRRVCDKSDVRMRVRHRQTCTDSTRAHRKTCENTSL